MFLFSCEVQADISARVIIMLIRGTLGQRCLPLRYGVLVEGVLVEGVLVEGVLVEGVLVEGVLIEAG
jgi:hypothetical protein